MGTKAEPHNTLKWHSTAFKMRQQAEILPHVVTNVHWLFL